MSSSAYDPRHPIYEADSEGHIYERRGSEVMPTGITVMAYASRSDITQEEFDRHLRARGRLD